VFNSELYIPRAAIIDDIRKLTYDTKRYRVRFKSPRRFASPASASPDARWGGGQKPNSEDDKSSESDYKPGQFVQVSVLGAGEVPISICSSPTQKGYFELSVRNTGLVTGAIHALKKGDEIGIRGPYGNCFPIEQAVGRNLIFVGGGIGLAPLRSAIMFVLHKRSDYGSVQILYGSRSKEDIVFVDDLEQWGTSKQSIVYTTIDRPQPGWTGHTGVVTTLFDKIRGLTDSKVFICGPSIMIHFAIKELLDAGWAPDDIITTLERHMKCGVGKCGHCYLGGKYVCTDGPVFTYSQINALGVEV